MHWGCVTLTIHLGDHTTNVGVITDKCLGLTCGLGFFHSQIVNWFGSSPIEDELQCLLCSDLVCSDEEPILMFGAMFR